MTFISCISLITLITLILIILIMVRCVKILELSITCGRTKGLAKTVDDLGDQFCPAMRAGWLANIRISNGLLGRRRPCCRPARGLWGRPPWWSQIESIVLLFATNSDPVWWWMPLASIFQWMPGRIANSCFVIMYNIWNKWKNSVISANNSHKYCTVSALLESTTASLVLLNLKWHRKLSPAYLQSVGHF